MWPPLITFQGTKQVMQTHINILKHDFKLFLMEENEKVELIFERLTTIMNDIHSHERIILEPNLILNILQSLSKT